MKSDVRDGMRERERETQFEQIEERVWTDSEMNSTTLKIFGLLLYFQLENW